MKNFKIFARRLPGQKSKIKGTQRADYSTKTTVVSDFSAEETRRVRRKSFFDDVPTEDKCLHDFFLDKFQNFGSSIAFVNSDNNKKVTYIELYELCHRLAAGLRQHGLAKGDRVTVCLPNCPEFTSIVLGVSLAGGVPSPINPAYTIEELISHFNLSTPSYIFVRSENLEKILNAINSLNFKLKGIFVQNEFRKESNNDVHSLETLFCNTDSQSSTKIRWNTKKDLALLPFSSGTTGLPKGIMLSHHNFVTLLQLLQQPSKFDFPTKGDHMVSALPFYHIYGSVMLFRSLEIGSTMWTMSKFQKELYLKIIQDNKVPVIFVVPPILNYLAKADEAKNYDLSCVRSCLSGAAPAGKQLILELESKYPNMHVLQGYGMTEMSGVSHIMPKYTPKGQKYGSCGMLISNYETKIVNDETGEELGYNQVGEICVRSQTCMLGYYDNEKATKDIYDNENFLHTGDLGYYDNEGYLYIVDRLKELIKVRGFQVAPAELEDILLSHHGIKDAAVIGIPDPIECEIPKAFVVLKDESKVDKDELMNFVNSKLIHYKHLKGGVEFVKEIPKSPSGKILRRLLRQSTTSRKP